MKLINQAFKVIEQEDFYDIIEFAGRICYKSQRPEGTTAEDFVEKLIKMKHYSVLEHGTIYLKIPKNKHIAINHPIFKNPYTKWTVKDGDAYITTNYRVILENKWKYLLKHLCEPTEYHEKRITVHFITSIGIVRELLRHRKFSFSNESTRYIGYNKAKHGGELTYIIPSWVNMPEVDIDTTDGMYCKTSEYEITEFEKYYELLDSWAECEQEYLTLMDNGMTPQQAREVLPLATKSELVMTGFESDWKDLFDKRSSIASTGKPHPDMIKLIDPLMHEIKI